MGRQTGKFIEKNINKLTYDRYVVRNLRIQRFSGRQGNQIGKKSRAGKTNKTTPSRKDKMG